MGSGHWAQIRVEDDRKGRRFGQFDRGLAVDGDDSTALCVLPGCWNRLWGGCPILSNFLWRIGIEALKPLRKSVVGMKPLSVEAVGGIGVYSSDGVYWLSSVSVAPGGKACFEKERRENSLGLSAVVGVNLSPKF